MEKLLDSILSAHKLQLIVCILSIGMSLTYYESIRPQGKYSEFIDVMTEIEYALQTRFLKSNRKNLQSNLKHFISSIGKELSVNINIQPNRTSFIEAAFERLYIINGVNQKLWSIPQSAFSLYKNSQIINDMGKYSFSGLFPGKIDSCTLYPVTGKQLGLVYVNDLNIEETELAQIELNKGTIVNIVLFEHGGIDPESKIRNYVKVADAKCKVLLTELVGANVVSSSQLALFEKSIKEENLWNKTVDESLLILEKRKQEILEEKKELAFIKTPLKLIPWVSCLLMLSFTYYMYALSIEVQKRGGYQDSFWVISIENSHAKTISCFLLYGLQILSALSWMLMSNDRLIYLIYATLIITIHCFLTKILTSNIRARSIAD